MTAERHLPSREPDEDDTSATKKLLGMSKERLLLPGSDMLNDIVHQYDIVTSRLICRNGCFQKVFGYKSSCSPTCFKEGTCLLDSPVTDVDTRHDSKIFWYSMPRSTVILTCCLVYKNQSITLTPPLSALDTLWA